jgi:hypothetical protein
LYAYACGQAVKVEAPEHLLVEIAGGEDHRSTQKLTIQQGNFVGKPML